MNHIFLPLTPPSAREFAPVTARALNWPVALPLLAGELFSRKSSGDGRRTRPAEHGWTKAVALAYARAALAALDLAHDLSRWAARLAEAAPKLRAKGKAGALVALLADDAVSGGHVGGRF